MKIDKWKWVERGISLIVILGVVAGWLITATVKNTRAKVDMEYLKTEMAEMKEDIKEVKKTGEDTNIRVNENANNITQLTTIVEFLTE